jgi:hypothetical protein
MMDTHEVHTHEIRACEVYTHEMPVPLDQP